VKLFVDSILPAARFAPADDVHGLRPPEPDESRCEVFGREAQPDRVPQVTSSPCRSVCHLVAISGVLRGYWELRPDQELAERMEKLSLAPNVSSLSGL